MWKSYSYTFSLCPPDFLHCRKEAQETSLSGMSPKANRSQSNCEEGSQRKQKVATAPEAL